MRVLVDASHLHGASANRGIGTYLRNVLPRLAAEPDLDLVGLAPSGTPLPAGVRPRRVARRAPGRWAQREHDLRLPFDLRAAARAEPVDVVFSPADDPPRTSPRPFVQMLHDVIPLAVDSPAFAADAQRWLRVGARLQSAAAVCTNSASTAADAIRFLRIARDRLHVIPLGVDARFCPPWSRRRGGDEPRILFVGEYGPHKGFAEAFAVAAALGRRGLPHRLAMVGHLAPWHEAAVQALLAEADRPDLVDLLGFVDDVVATYRSADALIVTSRYEGFCLPALEAMACGTPVVAFDNSAIGETVGAGGVLVRDGDVDGFADALTLLLSEDDVWNAWSQRGIARARDFTWDRCAAAHADVFRSVVARQGA
ncbi:MAG TPA: glycosyltransferase family 1 protein [Acidimicrobiia bacterium]|nr:glycosyltransferase family 1 protein [Acidimicrobiia bacterium]